MKSISIIQPHAELIRLGLKMIETRSWRTNYRGEILIHASKTKIPKSVKENTKLMSLIGNPDDLKFGFLLCKAVLIGCEEITPGFIYELKQANPTEFLCGYYEVGRYAWMLRNVEPIEPVQMNGHLGIWNCNF